MAIQKKYDEAISNFGKVTSTKFLFYKVQTMGQFTYKNNKQGSASTFLFYDKSLKQHPYNTIIDRVSRENGIYDLNIEEGGTPFVPSAFDEFKKNGV